MHNHLTPEMLRSSFFLASMGGALPFHLVDRSINMYREFNSKQEKRIAEEAG